MPKELTSGLSHDQLMDLSSMLIGTMYENPVKILELVSKVSSHNHPFSLVTKDLTGFCECCNACSFFFPKDTLNKARMCPGCHEEQICTECDEYGAACTCDLNTLYGFEDDDFNEDDDDDADRDEMLDWEGDDFDDDEEDEDEDDDFWRDK